MKSTRTWMIATLAVLVACSDSHDRSPGSQTHFLESCDSSCAAPYDCICGVCTVACTKDAQCGDHASGAECAAAPAIGGAQCTAASEMCDVTCKVAGDCSALGAGYACESGRCRVPSSDVHVGGSDAGKPDSGTSPIISGSTDGGVVTTGSGGSVADAGSISTDAGMSTPICDGSDGIRFGVVSTPGWGISAESVFMNPLGPFMVIDGQCRFYASWNGMTGIVQGTLDAAEAEQLASAAGWNELATFSKFANYNANCADGGGAIISDGSRSFGCTCGCDAAAPPSLERASTSANDWVQRLVNEGTAIDGPVSAIASVFGGGTPPPGEPQTWPLLRPISDILYVDSVPSEGVLFDNPDDAAALRVLRSTAVANFPDAQQIYATDGTQDYLLYVRDELDSDTLARITAFRDAALSYTP